MAFFLVTGGTGFIGRSIVERLSYDGHQVRVIDNFSRNFNADHIFNSKNIEVVKGDVRIREDVAKALKGVDRVLHMAYINGTQNFYTRPYEILEVGIKGMLNILDECKVQGVKELSLISTSEVYQLPKEIPTPETVPLIVPDVDNPRFSYGGGKIASELLLVNYARENLDKFSIIRPHNVYGPNMGFEHVIPQLILKIRNAQRENTGTVEIQGSGDETRAFCYISDFVDGSIIAMNDSKYENRIFHIGTSIETPISELFQIIAQELKFTGSFIPGSLSEGSVQRRVPNIAKVKQIGYLPKVSMADGIYSTVKWYLKNETN